MVEFDRSICDNKAREASSDNRLFPAKQHEYVVLPVLEA